MQCFKKDKSQQLVLSTTNFYISHCFRRFCVPKHRSAFMILFLVDIVKQTFLVTTFSGKMTPQRSCQLNLCVRKLVIFIR